MDAVATEVKIESESELTPIYATGLLAQELENLTDQKKLQLNEQVRREIFSSLKANSNRPDDPVALMLEEHAGTGERVWISLAAVNSTVTVRALNVEEQLLEWNKIEDLIIKLAATSSRSDDKHDLPEHMRALIKKFNHVKCRRETEGTDIQSRFNRYRYPELGISNIEKFNQIMLDLIETMFKSAGTIIDTPNSIQFITSFGIGVNAYKQFDEGKNLKGLNFGGLIDLAAYSKHTKKGLTD